MSIELILGVAIPVALILIGKVVGARIERRHFEDIAEREAQFEERPALTTKDSGSLAPIRKAELVSGFGRRFDRPFQALRERRFE